MAVTKDDLRNYRNMFKALDALDLEIEAAYNTYKSPQFSNDGGHSDDPGDPVVRALQKIESLKKERQDLLKQIRDIEDFVSSIEDWYERAICKDHYITGLTWESTCQHLCKHNSTSVVKNYDRKWWEKQCAGS